MATKTSFTETDAVQNSATSPLSSTLPLENDIASQDNQNTKQNDKASVSTDAGSTASSEAGSEEGTKKVKFAFICVSPTLPVPLPKWMLKMSSVSVIWQTFVITSHHRVRDTANVRLTTGCIFCARTAKPLTLIMTENMLEMNSAQERKRNVIARVDELHKV